MSERLGESRSSSLVAHGGRVAGESEVSGSGTGGVGGGGGGHG